MEFIRVSGSGDGIFGAQHDVVLALLLFTGLVYVLLKEVRRSRWSSRRRWFPKRRSLRPIPFQQAPDVADPAQQMNLISRVDFETIPLLNREEYRVYSVLERTVGERRDGYRLMAQTSLGEIIRPKPVSGSRDDRDLAFRSINSKRLDFAIFDRSGRLAVAIEYQGSGHYHAKSFIRDAVKKEALRKAGVPLLEVPVRFHPEELADQVRRTLPGRAPRAESGPVTETGPEIGVTNP